MNLLTPSTLQPLNRHARKWTAAFMSKASSQQQNSLSLSSALECKSNRIITNEHSLSVSMTTIKLPNEAILDEMHCALLVAARRLDFVHHFGLQSEAPAV
jgi:hypothetical protein